MGLEKPYGAKPLFRGENMSTYDIAIRWIGNGFIKNWWSYHKADAYMPSRTSPENKPFHRFAGRHKRMGATRGCTRKQFDIRPFKAFTNFKSRTSIPHHHEINWSTFHFRFGIKRNKFFY